MGVWKDKFSGLTYEYDDAWQEAVLTFLAQRCIRRLSRIECRDKVKVLADELADFWASEYYDLVFPLRFSHADEDQILAGGTIQLKYSPGVGFRSGLGVRDGLPPVVSGGPDPVHLLGDHVCAVAAAANLLSRANGLAHLVDHIRLGCLLHEVWPYVRPLLAGIACMAGGQLELGFQVASVLCGGSDSIPGEVHTVISAAHDGPEAGESAAELCGRSEIAFLVGAAQRLKQYVTEGQSLRSIRGAASILDRVTAKLAEEVADGVGRECVLRDAGSVLECVVPADQAPWWKDRIRSVFFSETDAVFAATGYVRCTVGHLLSDEFGDARQRAWRLVESDRDGAEWPGMETLPFEARCLRCGVRSAEIDSGNPPGSGDRRSQILCGACRVRETEGSRIRRERVIKAIEIGLGRGGTGPRDLGVTHDFPDALPPSLDEMVPRFSDVRDKVGVITFDGDNFGQLVRSLRDYASSVQWSRRTRNTVRVAAYRALCEAVQSAADRRPGLFDYLPFEVLLLSGDEFTAITWEGIALDTAKCFLEYADREYSAVKHDIHFSGAVTTCSKKAPARLLLESCEALLKVAKRHAKQREEGVVNFLVTDSLAELPDDPAELAEMLFKDPETKGGEPLCLTLLPLSARELGFMLERAREVVRKNQVGPLKRLAGAYLRRPSAVAKLFFLYYMARAKDAGLQDMVGAKARLAWTDVFPEICLPDSTVPGRLPLTIDGHLRGDHPTQVRFTPLRDLVEIAKTLPRTGG